MKRTYKTPVEYTWTLSHEHPGAHRPAGYAFGFAEPADAAAVGEVLAAVVCAEDPLLEPFRDELTRQTAEGVRAALRAGSTDYIIARRGNAVAAVAAVTNAPGEDGHLPGGVYVLPEHQNRGVERYLLHLALLWLREMGVKVARGYAEAGSALDRTVYPCFGGCREGIAYARRRLERDRRAEPCPTRVTPGRVGEFGAT